MYNALDSTKCYNYLNLAIFCQHAVELDSDISEHAKLIMFSSCLDMLLWTKIKGVPTGKIIICLHLKWAYIHT